MSPSHPQHILDLFQDVCTRYAQSTALTQHLSRNKQFKISFAQLNFRANALADYLLQRGLQPQAKVGLYMRRCPEQVIAMLAILKAGAIFYNLNPKLSAAQVNYSLKICASSWLLVDNTALLRLQQANTLMPTKLLRFSDEILTPIHASLIDKLSQHLQVDNLSYQDLNTTDPVKSVLSSQSSSASMAATVLFTSGSTGDPKAVQIGHTDLLKRVSKEITAYALTSEDRLLNVLPFSFDVGLNQLFSTLCSGAELILLNSWLAVDICHVIKQHQITGVSGVPSLWAQLMANPDSTWQKQAQESLQNLRYLTISGGDMPIPQLQQLRQLVPQTQIYKTYGQTEAFRLTMLLPAEFDKHMESVGRVIPGVELLIVNSQNQPVPTGEQGEVVMSGEGMMQAYLNDTRHDLSLRRHPLRNGRMAIYTGDIGRLDEQAYLYLLGRKDKMLKIQGNRVYPQEVVHIMLTHEAIQEAVVVGGENKIGEKILCAAVRLRPTMRLTLIELKAFLSQHLPSYMQPTQLQFVEDFPRTPSGKIQLSTIEDSCCEC